MKRFEKLFLILGLLLILSPMACMKIVSKRSNPFAVVYVPGSHNPVMDMDYDEQDFVFVFTANSCYELDTDQDDWNKLFGRGYPTPQGYSARWTWCYDPKRKKVALAAYWHHDGKVDWQVVDSVKLNEPIRLSFDDSGYSNYYFFSQKLGKERKLTQIPKYHNRLLVKDLNGYFGGNRTPNQPVSYLVYSEYKGLL